MSDKAKLSKRTVDAAEPRGVRYVVWDTDLKGFGLRVAPTGTKTYIVRYRPRNLGGLAPKRYVVVGRHGPLTADEARSRARAILGSVAAGQDPAKERQELQRAVTVAELARLFVDQHVAAKRKARTAQGYAAVLKSNVLPKLGRLAADKLSTQDIAQLHLSMRDRPYQANRMLAIVASMYSFAERRGLTPKGCNPARGLERFREQTRERYLTGDELQRLGDTLRLAETEGLPWASVDAPSKHMPKEANRRVVLSRDAVLAIRLLLFTGARLREILHLEWSQFDADRGLLLLPDSKTGRKTIVLSAIAQDLLRAHKRAGRYVIAGSVPDRPRADLKKPWMAVQRHADLEGVRLHDLRHTFASVGAGASLGLPIVGKLLGHSQPATTARYAHLDADPLRRAADQIGQTLAVSMVRPE